jgi:hypothetical protein
VSRTKILEGFFACFEGFELFFTAAFVEAVLVEAVLSLDDWVFLDVAFEVLGVVLDLLDLSFLTLAFLPEVEVGMEQQFS